jgi:dihydroxy-acid dehydratase
LHTLRDTLELDALTVTGQTLGELLEGPPPWSDPQVVRPRHDPIRPTGGLVWLTGSLAPQGALIKRSAADPSLFEKTGRAVVFTSLEDLAARIDDPNLDVEPEDILVLRNAGPVASGMPEAGYLPIPAKLAARGVRDMIRLSDARMSGTAYGTIVLHVTPEAAVGGPLALVRDGDLISLSVRGARLDLLVDEDELARRRAALPAAESRFERGYRRLFQDHVLQADHGCDFDFCVPDPKLMP